MKQCMKKISVTDIVDNMIVGRDVCGSSGNVLITKGTTLTSALARRLETWGILNVFIEGEEDVEPQTNILNESPEVLKSQLLDKFSSVMDNPLMKKIFNAVYEYRKSKH